MQEVANKDREKKDRIQSAVLIEEDNENLGGGGSDHKIPAPQQPIGYLKSEKIQFNIAVYKKLSCLQKFMWKCLLGFKYVKA